MERESFRKYIINKIASERITVYRGIEGKFNLNFNTPQFFSVSKTIAQSYGENLYEFELQLNKPFELDNKEEQQKELMPIIEKVNRKYFEERDYIINIIKDELKQKFQEDEERYKYYENLLLEDPRQFVRDIQELRLNRNLETFIQIFENKFLRDDKLYLTFLEQQDNLKEIINLLKSKGYDSIIRIEESMDASNTGKGVIIWNKNNIISYKKIASVEY